MLTSIAISECRSDTLVQYLNGTTETSKPMSPASLALQKNIPIQTSNSPVEGAKRLVLSSAILASFQTITCLARTKT